MHILCTKLKDRMGLQLHGSHLARGGAAAQSQRSGTERLYSDNKPHADFPDDVAKMILRYGNLGNDDDFAEFDSIKTKAITLNCQLFDDTPKLKTSYDALVQLRHFPKGTDYKSVIVHEFGHQYDYAHNLDTGTMLRDAYRSITGMNPNAGKIKKMLRVQLSEYATSDAGKPYTEAIAECFNQWYNSDEQSEICKYVMNRILG